MTRGGLTLGLLLAALGFAAPAHAAVTVEVVGNTLEVRGGDAPERLQVIMQDGPNGVPDWKVSSDGQQIVAGAGCEAGPNGGAVCVRPAGPWGSAKVLLAGDDGNDRLSVFWPYADKAGDEIRIEGGPGDDEFYGSLAPGDVIDAGPGNDIVNTWDDYARDIVDCGPGDADVIHQDVADTHIGCETPDDPPRPRPHQWGPCPSPGSGARLRMTCPPPPPPPCSTLPPGQRSYCYDPPCQGPSYRPAPGESCLPGCNPNPNVAGHCDSFPRWPLFDGRDTHRAVRVSRGGRFTLERQLVGCQEPGVCHVTTAVSAPLESPSGKVVEVSLGRLAYATKPAMSPLRGRLSASGLRRVIRRRSVPARILVTVATEDRTLSKLIAVKLLAPRRTASRRN